MQELYHAVYLTRMEAIKRHTIVTICGISHQGYCEGDWSKGYVIFVDKNHNNLFDKNDLFIQFGQFENFHGILRWTSFPKKQDLQFQANGFTNYQNGTFLYCPNNDKRHAKALFVSQSGSIQFSEDSNGDGIAKCVKKI